MKQRTLKSSVRFYGTGIHSGKKSEIVIVPSKEFSGINFIVKNIKIEASVENVLDTKRCTTLGKNGCKLLTVEHLLASFYALGIDNLDVFVEGEEIPIMDGGASYFVKMLLEAGIKIQKENKVFFSQKKSFTKNIDNAVYVVKPIKERCLKVSCRINLDKDFLAKQEYSLILTSSNFVKKIAPSKTFCFLKDVELLRSQGLAQGGTLENAIVIGEGKIINSEILTFKNEFVRHKILDFIGDLSLLGVYLRNLEIRIYSPSHYTNIEFVKCLKKKFLEV